MTGSVVGRLSRWKLSSVYWAGKSQHLPPLHNQTETKTQLNSTQIYLILRIYSES